MGAVQPNLFDGRFLQAAYVTTDLTRAIAAYAERTGVSRFLELRDLEVDAGDGRIMRSHVGLATAGGVQIELIEPAGGADDVYRDALQGDDFQIRFHHQGWLVEDRMALDRIKAETKARGWSIAVDGQHQGRAFYFYADLRPLFGHYLEYICYAPDLWAELSAAIPEN